MKEYIIIEQFAYLIVSQLICSITSTLNLYKFEWRNT
jgi:hypothetical protein